MLYWSYPVSWVVTFGVHVLCFLWALQKVKHRLLPAAETPEKALSLEE